MSEKVDEMDILKAVAHPIRKGIIISLTYGQRVFSHLMLDCGLDPNSETGLFLYHLSRLMEEGFVEKNRRRYGLTEHGERASRLLQTIPHLGISLQNNEKGEKMESRNVIEKISVKEVVGGDMLIDKWEFKPNEKRLYKESGRVPSSDFSGSNFYIKKCIGIVDVPKELGTAFMIRHEGYARKYIGTEKNRLRTPLRDGYYLTMREYDTFSTKDDGVYMLWTSVWGPNYEDEKPEETIYEPPEKMKEPPMKVSDETRSEKKEGDYLHNMHGKVIGQYTVTIDDVSFDCLLKRTHSTWIKNGIEISRVAEKFVTYGLVDILTRAYHATTQKRRWMLESVKDWEMSPTVKCCGEKHYLTSEYYLTRRTY